MSKLSTIKKVKDDINVSTFFSLFERITVPFEQPEKREWNIKSPPPPPPVQTGWWGGGGVETWQYIKSFSSNTAVNTSQKLS